MTHTHITNILDDKISFELINILDMLGINDVTFQSACKQFKISLGNNLCQAAKSHFSFSLQN